MAVRKTVHRAPEHLDVGELARLQGGDALVVLPDTLSPVDGQMVAGFRPGAQALRVRAEEEGVPVTVLVLNGARAGRYSEHAAEWVLPLILGVPAASAAQLIANEIQRWIAEGREQGRSPIPLLSYREVIVESKTQRT